jgi:ribosomal protein L37AE/L43A
MSGASSVPDIAFSVPCPYCLSDVTELIDNEYGIYYCPNCETRFEHPSTESADSVDRDGQGRPPAGG